MPRKENNKIQCEHLILCEGRDEQEFLIRYLNSPALSDVPAFSKDIQVMDFGGNSELALYLQMLKSSPDFQLVKSILIIRDAESDADAAVKEIQSALQKASFPVPPAPHLWEGQELRTGFLLFPTCDGTPEKGTLEDLCLTILAEPQAPEILSEIDSFLMQLRGCYNRNFSRPFKARLHTYFSTHDKYVSFKIGEAASAGAFDWFNAALKPLRDFLLEIL